MNLARRFAQQLARPRGLAGRLIGNAMDVANRRPTRLDYVDNDGNAGHYRIGLDGDRLTIDWPDFRFTGALRDDLIAGTWELRESGGGWAYWYDATLSRIEHGGASTPL